MHFVSRWEGKEKIKKEIYKYILETLWNVTGLNWNI